MTTSFASRFHAVRQQIIDIAQHCGRDPAAVRLLAVSKTQDIQAINALYLLGQRAFGENYIQEAIEKMAHLPKDIEWHCIGPVQSNKSRLVAEHFAWCHTVASEKLLHRLSTQRPASLPPLNTCIQLHIGDEDTKSGVDAAEALRLAKLASTLPNICLRGVMCIPPPAETECAQRAYFAQARLCFEAIQEKGIPVDTLSIGMSGDLSAAIKEESTLVRVGTALFGARPAKHAQTITKEATS